MSNEIQLIIEEVTTCHTKAKYESSAIVCFVPKVIILHGGQQLPSVMVNTDYYGLCSSYHMAVKSC